MTLTQERPPQDYAKALFESKPYPPAETARILVEQALKTEFGPAIVEVVLLGSARGNWAMRKLRGFQTPLVGDFDMGLVIDTSQRGENQRGDLFLNKCHFIILDVLRKCDLDMNLCRALQPLLMWFDIQMEQSQDRYLPTIEEFLVAIDDDSAISVLAMRMALPYFMRGIQKQQAIASLREAVSKNYSPHHATLIMDLLIPTIIRRMDELQLKHFYPSDIEKVNIYCALAMVAIIKMLDAKKTAISPTSQ